MPTNAKDPEWKPIRINLDLPAQEGRCFLIIGPLCWGRGPTPRAALKEARKEWNPRNGKRAIVLDAPAGTYVDDMGYTCWKEPARCPEQLARIIMTTR